MSSTADKSDQWPPEPRVIKVPSETVESRKRCPFCVALPRFVLAVSLAVWIYNFAFAVFGWDCTSDCIRWMYAWRIEQALLSLAVGCGFVVFTHFAPRGATGIVVSMLTVIALLCVAGVILVSKYPAYVDAGGGNMLTSVVYPLLGYHFGSKLFDGGAMWLSQFFRKARTVS